MLTRQEENEGSIHTEIRRETSLFYACNCIIQLLSNSQWAMRKWNMVLWSNIFPVNACLNFCDRMCFSYVDVTTLVVIVCVLSLKLIMVKEVLIYIVIVFGFTCRFQFVACKRCHFAVALYLIRLGYSPFWFVLI